MSVFDPAEQGHEVAFVDGGATHDFPGISLEVKVDSEPFGQLCVARVQIALMVSYESEDPQSPAPFFDLIGQPKSAWNIYACYGVVKP